MNPYHLAGVLLCVAGLSTGQICFKRAAAAVTDTAGVRFLTTLAINPWFLTAMVVYGAATVLWVLLLRELTLREAYPFFALSFAFVPLLAWLVLGERTSLLYWGGVALIIGGICITAFASNGAS